MEAPELAEGRSVMERLQTAFFNSTRGFSINIRTDQTVYSIDLRKTKTQCNL